MTHWDNEGLEHALEELHRLERIPVSPRRQPIRDRLVGSAIRVGVVETQLGWVGLVFSESGLRSLELPRQSRAEMMRRLATRYPTSEILDSIPEQYSTALCDYARGKRAEFDWPIDLPSMRPFQRAVLDAIRNIPFAETRSYGWVARAIGQPQATRAVGQALNKNPIPIIIPCHRVISSDGSLGGYAGGLPMKHRLILLEQGAH